MRAAPIQLSYIGYLGTMAAEYFEYLVADSTIIPKNKQQYYSEKIVYLPSYQVNDTKREVSRKVFSREELGLPGHAFVFCCFNNNYKIKPATFDSWMRILTKVDGSVLLLLDANGTATKNLKKEATFRGVSLDRIIFCKRVPSPYYLARYRVADLFLDTLPYNAGTTASDALRVGLPVLTQMGESFASRVAASLLNAVGLPELITTTPEAYESLAIELASNPQKLEEVKNKLLTNLPVSPLYNSKLFTQHIESAYQLMYQRHQDELTPDYIYIKN
jgi:predicted O-linked N-acetylglucosamine transferase (SPINDLY family)